MKVLIMLTLLTTSLSSNAFYCADGTGKFRIELKDKNNKPIRFNNINDKDILIADISNASEMNFAMGKEDFQVKVRKSEKETTITYYNGENEVDELLSLTMSNTPVSSRVIGGSWLDPNSGEKVHVYKVTEASYQTDRDQYVHLDDLFEESMECWYSGDEATLE